jgi:hypothetical protein
MQKWEYLRLEFSTAANYAVNGKKQKWGKDETRAAFLNHLGQEGWELVGIATAGAYGGTQYYAFKRPLGT